MQIEDVAMSPTEERLAAIWAEVLEVARVGRSDDFFDLGGHSLLATLVITRVLAEMHVRLDLSTFFDEPTVAGLARIIDGAKRP